MHTITPKLILPGGAGFLGQLLADWFAQRGWDVVILSRRPQPDRSGVRRVHWDGESLGPWTQELEYADALINLAGRSVDCRYHSRNRRAILNSRLNSTRVLADAVRACRTPPRVWLNSSTATIYKHSFD
ncbi:MAG: NAD-dependent epimerase/dehydratase family protein, partial [Actinomycetota bacterium]